MSKKKGEKDELKRTNTMDKTVEEGKLFIEEFERLAKRKEREERKRSLSPNKRQKRSNSPKKQTKSKSPKRTPSKKSPKRVTKRKSPARQVKKATPKSTVAPPVVLENDLQKGESLFNNKDYQGAIDSVQKYLQDNPNDIKALELLGKTFSQLKRHEEAIEEYKKILIIDPQSDVTYNRIGYDLDELHRNGEAIESYKLALKYAPENSNGDYYFNLAIAEMYNKQPRDAIEHFLIVQQKEPLATDIDDNIALSYIYLKEFELAKKYLEKAIKVNSSRSVLLLQCFYWVCNKEFALAKESYDKLTMRINPNAYVLYFKAIVEFKLGRYASAIEFLQRLLNNIGGGIYKEDLLYYYARSLYKSSINNEKIVSDDNNAEKEENNNNNNNEIKDDKNEVAKENKEVEEKLNECITLNPNWSKPYYFRAQYYLSLDNKLKAKEDLEKAIEVNAHPRTLPYDRLSNGKITHIQVLISSLKIKLSI